MENRYDDKLREGNQLIIDLSPANYTERIISSLELKNALGGANGNMLEIGIGEGDLTKYIFKYNPEISLDAVDISPEMIEIAKRNLSVHARQVQYFCEDAFTFLRNNAKQYDAIISSWVIHNFKQADKLDLFREIFAKLKDDGAFILFDKIYPDDENESERLFDLQIKRYDYLEGNLRREIISHEKQDFTPDYRMDEAGVLQTLKDIGFKDFKIADRVERDVVLVAKK
jgi:SAM-dependent methyltransferase